MSIIGEIKKGELGIEWSIKNFLSLPAEIGTFYKSPDFSFSNESWYLRVYPKEEIKFHIDNYIGLSIHRETCGLPITIECTLGMKNAEGNLDTERRCTFVFEKIPNSYVVCSWISLSEILERKFELLPFDTLTLVCRMKKTRFVPISSFSNTVTIRCFYCNKTLDSEEGISSHLRKCEGLPIECQKNENIPIAFQKCCDEVALKVDHKCQKTEVEDKECGFRSFCNPPENKIPQDYKATFLRKGKCDVIIRVKDKEFSAHKVILAAHSSVFESIFRNGMNEKETVIVNVEDCDPSSFSDFLRFLYCEETETLSKENVFSLFTTADRYNVQDLRDICVKFMKENISVNTFYDIVTLALLYCENELITLATDFFVKNAGKIVKTAQWQKFSVENPTKSNELIIKLINARE